MSFSTADKILARADSSPAAASAASPLLVLEKTRRNTGSRKFARQRKTGSDFLSGLSAALQTALEPNLHRTTLARGAAIYESGSKIEFLYFPEKVIVSRLVQMEDGSLIETGMLGRESVVGARALIAGDQNDYLTVAENKGEALKMEIESARYFFEKSKEFQNAALGCYEKLLAQVSQKAACRSRHTISKQLCVWLLHFQERALTRRLDLTQETIAQRLGARRSTITVAINELEAKKIISCGRGNIKILDRLALITEACECYYLMSHKSQV